MSLDTFYIQQSKGVVNQMKTHPGWNDRGANILVVAIITIVAPLVVRCAPPVQRQ